MMKTTLKRLWALALCVLLTLTLAAPAAAEGSGSKTVTVLFTHDTHDHFLPDAADVGGYTRLATLLKREREKAATPVVTLDAGDFSMGSFLQTVYATDAPELRALGYMGYDVTTFGNHEYDFRPQGLAGMLRAAKASGDPLPAIVQANYHTPKADYGKVAVEAMAEYPVTDYTILERDGVTLGIFGLVGVDSDECTPMSGMALEPVADAAKRVIADIRANYQVDYIVALSHVGTEDGKGEDYELAKAVDGIDLIISGHTHATLREPIVVNNTVIASCGPYTRNLGKLVLTKEGGATKLEHYELIPIDSSIPADPGMTELVEGYKELVNANYLSGYGLEYDQVLTTAAQDFSTAQTGDLIGQAYISTIKELEGEGYVPIAFAVAPDGVIRDRVRKGDVTTDNAFTILSLGVGADGTPAYPLMSLYLTGADLKNAFEVDASVSSIMSAATLYGAGSTWSYNSNRMFLDRVTDCRANGEKIENDKLYRVVADLYSGQMLAAVESKSFGLLSITPRDAQGEPITDYEDCIIHDREGNEIKAWYALAHYLSQTGPGLTPGASSKTVEKSWNPVKLLVPMGKFTFLVVMVGLLLIAVIVVIIYLIATRRKRRALRLARQAGWKPQPRQRRR